MTPDEVLRRLRRGGAEEFVNTLLFNEYSWIFPTRSNLEYEDFRQQFAVVFGVHSTDVAIVGSAKYGFSLSPSKDFRKFQPDEHSGEQSDLDIVVISRSLFNETWHHLRRADYNGAINARKYFQDDVFRRFIMIGADDERDGFYLRDLSKLIDRVRRTATTRFAIAQTIKLRVYATWTDAKAYHIWSMQKLAEQHGIQ